MDMKRLIDRIDNAAARPEDPPLERLHKTLLIFLCTFGVLGAPWAAWVLRGAGSPAAAAVALAYAGLSAAALLHLVTTKRSGFARWGVMSGSLAAPALIQWLAGGFAPSGGAVLWAFLSPLCALVFWGARGSIPWFGAYAAAVLALTAKDLLEGVPVERVLLSTQNVLIVSALAYIAMRFFIDEREKAQAALEVEHRALVREQARSESLLLNILPAPIARRLKDHPGTIADGFAEVSILFGDIVGFTPLSKTVSPERLVEILNELFSRFDALAEKHGVEKIKTIGDAYMVCSGLPVPRSDHAEALAEMALDMLRAVTEHNRQFGTTLNMRIGINSGPVVAGVIGLKKFIYDLWGDTVNAASRMESHGVPGGIHATAATAELLRGRYELEDRGVIEVKGIGKMNTFLLKGRLPGREGT